MLRLLRTQTRYLILALALGLPTFTNTGCTHVQVPTAIEGEADLSREVYTRLRGTYFNLAVHTLHIEHGAPPEVRMIGQRLEVRIDGSGTQLDWATDEVVRLIQLNTPEEDWGELDPALFYDRSWGR